MSIKIMNMRNTKPSEPYDVRIDRYSVVGNPFYLTTESQRDHVCDKYQDHFDEEMEENNNGKFARGIRKILEVYLKYGKIRLFCWCDPKRCHGWTIKNWLIEVTK